MNPFTLLCDHEFKANFIDSSIYCLECPQFVGLVYMCPMIDREAETEKECVCVCVCLLTIIYALHSSKPIAHSTRYFRSVILFYGL